MANSIFITPFGGTIQGNVSVTGQVLAADGTAAAPSYSFATALGMGFYKYDSSGVGFAVAGASCLYLSNVIRMVSGADLSWTNSSSNPNTTLDVSLVRDAAAVLALKNGAAAQTVRVYGTTTGPKYLAVSHDGTNGVIDTAASSGVLSLAPTNATSVTIGKAITSLAGITANGALGVPVMVAGPSTRKSAVTSAQTLSTFTVGAADASFEVSANVLITAATTHSFNVTVSYTDEGNTARVATLNFATLAGVISNAAITNVAGAVPYEGVPYHIRCKAATSITVATSGTFTTVTYNAEGLIKQVA